MNASATPCHFVIPAHDKVTCSYSWAVGSARAAAGMATANRQRVHTLWQRSRATDAEVAAAVAAEDEAWKAHSAAINVLVAHRHETGCCR